MGQLRSQGCCAWAQLGRERSSTEGKPWQCCRDGCFGCWAPAGVAQLGEGPGCARAVVAGDVLPPNGVLGTQLVGAQHATSPLWEQDGWPEPMGALWMLKAEWQWGPGCHFCWAGTVCRAQAPPSFWGMEMGTGCAWTAHYSPFVLPLTANSVPQLQPASWRSPCQLSWKWRSGAQPGLSATSTSLRMLPTPTSTGSM